MTGGAPPADGTLGNPLCILSPKPRALISLLAVFLAGSNGAVRLLWITEWQMFGFFPNFSLYGRWPRTVLLVTTKLGHSRPLLNWSCATQSTSLTSPWPITMLFHTCKQRVLLCRFNINASLDVYSTFAFLDHGSEDSVLHHYSTWHLSQLWISFYSFYHSSFWGWFRSSWPCYQGLTRAAKAASP